MHRSLKLPRWQFHAVRSPSPFHPRLRLSSVHSLVCLYPIYIIAISKLYPSSGHPFGILWYFCRKTGMSQGRSHRFRSRSGIRNKKGTLFSVPFIFSHFHTFISNIYPSSAGWNSSGRSCGRFFRYGRAHGTHRGSE